MDVDQAAEVNRRLTALETGLAEVLEEIKSLKPVMNSQSTSLNWLTENTAGLFAGFKDMMASGGPAALLGSLGRKAS